MMVAHIASSCHSSSAHDPYHEQGGGQRIDDEETSLLTNPPSKSYDDDVGGGGGGEEEEAVMGNHNDYDDDVLGHQYQHETVPDDEELSLYSFDQGSITPLSGNLTPTRHYGTLLLGGGGGMAAGSTTTRSGGGGCGGGVADSSSSSTTTSTRRYNTDLEKFRSNGGGGGGSRSFHSASSMSTYHHRNAGGSSAAGGGGDGGVHPHCNDNGTESKEQQPAQQQSPSLPPPHPDKKLHPVTILCALSTASAFGCIAATLFLLVLPNECTRMGTSSDTRSVNLGFYIALGGSSQLISPLVGLASDKCTDSVMGRRRPFLLLGTALCVVGLMGMSISSYVGNHWTLYTVGFVLAMVSLNIVYSAVIALIPDLIPDCQTGVANGIFALLIVLGSVLGFVVFSYVLNENVQGMYSLYSIYLVITTILTQYVAKERPTTTAAATTTTTVWTPTSPRIEDAIAASTTGGHICYSLSSPRQSPPRGADRHGGGILHAMVLAMDSLLDVCWEDVKDAYYLSPEEHHDFFVVTVSRTFYYMGVSVQTFLMYFLHDIIHVSNPNDAVALLAAVGFFTGALTCYPVGFLSDYFGNGRKPYVYMSCFILAMGCIGLACSKTFHEVFILSCLVGGANGAYLTMDTSLAVDTLPSREDAAKFLGIWGVAGFVGSAMGPMLAGPMLYYFGQPGNALRDIVPGLPSTSSSPGTSFSYADDDDGAGSEYTIVGYAVIFGVSAVQFFLSALCLRWVDGRR